MPFDVKSLIQEEMNLVPLCEIMARRNSTKDTKGVRHSERLSCCGIRRCFISS